MEYVLDKEEIEILVRSYNEKLYDLINTFRQVHLNFKEYDNVQFFRDSLEFHKEFYRILIIIQSLLKDSVK